ncbi:CBM_collapsed_G0049170.mRNA.1.CDS.1 [Saccharomyces cerevisiae]|nr:CBM_collapsed_G0049170.mRNA.1.CDS.1 [Saccharomyces cerevisiae]
MKNAQKICLWRHWNLSAPLICALPSQNIHHLIREYSNVDQYGHQRRNSSLRGADMNDVHSISSNSTLQTIKTANLTRILTSDATVSKKDIETSGESLPQWMRKFSLTPLLVFFLKNCLRPCSMAVIIALTVAFIPWVKALFVTTANTPHISQAPDNAPPLSFFMDFTGYVGAACVPFGLILLGATLGRLKIGNLYPGFWKAAVTLVILRQCVMPIFGVLWCDRLVKAGWVNWQDDRMLLFVIAISWNLPTMTTLIYFTASFTPPETTAPIQMECVSFFLMLQYPLMVVSLPFLVSYFLKVQMNL